MIIKKFIPSMYLYNGHAVRGFEDRTIVDTDPVHLAGTYCSSSIDALLIFDLSDNDQMHEEALDIIREIVAISEVDVIGGGHIFRMEDVKKLLYAGCCSVVLNFEEENSVNVAREVAGKFGQDKLLGSIDSVETFIRNKELISETVSCIVQNNAHEIRELMDETQMLMIVSLRSIALNKFLEIFAYDTVAGITGNTINDNVGQIPDLKQICRENDIPVDTFEAAIGWDQLKKNSDGMIPVIVQDYRSDEVLMLAYMNEEAFNTTLRTGRMTYYSRSRNELWMKGETSGHYQYVKNLTADCDLDTILAKVSQIGAACHTGSRTCFFQEIAGKEYAAADNPLTVFQEVFDTISDRKVHPKEGSYTNYLFDKGIDKILKKVGEEATEIVIAAKNPNPNEIVYEISDFLYHAMVLMVEKGVTWEEVTRELANR